MNVHPVPGVPSDACEEFLSATEMSSLSEEESSPSYTMQVAPLEMACEMNLFPVVCVPGSAKNKVPSETWRLSNSRCSISVAAASFSVSSEDRAEPSGAVNVYVKEFSGICERICVSVFFMEPLYNYAGFVAIAGMDETCGRRGVNEETTGHFA